MLAKLRPRSVYDVMAALALFLVVAGGSAYAANTVFSADIVDGEVKAPDLAGAAVNNSKLAPNSVAAGKVVDNSLGGSDINESSLNLSSFFAATATTGGCTADSHVLTDCAAAFVTLPRPGRLLVNVTGEWHTFALDDTSGPGSDTDDATRVRGRCRLSVDGTQAGSSQANGERQQAGVAANHPEGGTMALTALSEVVPASTHRVAVSCTEEDGDMDWSQMNLTAALVDDDGTSAAAAARAPAPAGAADVADPGKR
jgi:hypothetical protein